VEFSNQLLPPSTKWVTFGGSYPGFLAAMARQYYPNLIHAAVSSSAPMNLLVDFVGYKERQAWDLQYDLVGGSADCLQTVLDGHVELADAIEAGFIDNVANMFNICDASSLLSDRNLGMFLGDGVVNVPAQNNDPSCQRGDACNLRKMCNFLSESQDEGATALESLAQLADEQQGFGCVELDWNKTLESLSNTDIDSDNWRSWLWQTCTEVGYYQTCEKDSLCPFGRGYHFLDMDYEICQVAYGLSEEQVRKNVEDTSKYFGDIRKRATRVLSVNGDVDPWSVLAILESEDPLMPAHVVKGASHHFWTHPVKETDNQEIKDARDIIHLKLMEWLEQSGDDEVVVKIE
jgi:pimeloyl-ACP methyl ester carboxylesterase